MVYLAESSAKRDGFKSTGLHFFWFIHRYENTSELGRSVLAATLEIDYKERPASEGGPYRIPYRSARSRKLGTDGKFPPF